MEPRPPSYAHSSDPRPPPAHHYSQYPPPPPQGQHPPPQPPHATQGIPPPTLPPIQNPGYPPPGAPPDANQLPALRHQSQQYHDARDVPGPDYHTYNRSGHGTPAPVNRSYSQDSAHPQRTPTTPAQPGPYPPTSAPDGQQYPPPHMEHAPHYGQPPNGLPNGHHNGPPPPGPPPPPQHHDQHHAMTPMMDSHYGYPPPHQPMYGHPPSYGPPTSFQVNTQRKKQMRATQACEQCRQRKQKCDEGNPCSFCKESNLTCAYRDTPPAKTDKNMERVMAFLEQNAQGISRLESQMATQIANQSHHNADLDKRLRGIEEQRFAGVASPAAQPSEPDEPKPVKRRKELDDHRTAPHKLILLWPSVRPLLNDAFVNVNDGYVMEAEDRGVLRLYGRGEGIDETDGTQPGGPASPARSEDSVSDNNAPTPPEGIWGRGFSIGQPHGEPNRSQPYTQGGLKPDGSLDLDQPTINSLFESYMKHMHTMHPILHKQRIREVFDRFISRYSPSRLRAPNSAFAVNNESDRPLKRQRSNGSTSVNMFAPEGPKRNIPDTERSPQNALVYLVLALGKICAHKDPLPAVVPDRALNANQVLAHHISGNSGFTNSSPVSANIKPSPISPKLTPTTQPTPPNFDGGVRLETRSRRSSLDGGSSQVAGPRNLDVIPGIAYFAKAAEILGDQGDGNDLVHVQMFLLAGLYKGQLARVKESMSWITMAGRAIQILLDRYKLYNDNYWTVYGDVRRQHEKGRQRNKDARSNLIVICSWTCLQLESDILAELRLPSSGIQDIENLLLMPHNETGEETYDGIEKEGSYYTNMLYYTSQMYLRRRLNKVHREMYGPECLSQPLGEVQALLEGHEDTLSSWRSTLPLGLKWDNEEPPPSDILAARLRAKYWGARYVINRPFLDYALHIMGHVQDGRSVEEAALDVHGNPRDKAEIHLFKAIKGMGATAIWDACRRCVEAAMQSTIAFDGVPDRLIVTNIHGTAHAQFGNMLVLAATYYSNHMKGIIDEKRFQRLLERTITFLRRLAPISPTCQNDCAILEKINRLLFALPPDVKAVYRNEGVEPMSTSGSFGSFSS